MNKARILLLLTIVAVIITACGGDAATRRCFFRFLRFAVILRCRVSRRLVSVRSAPPPFRRMFAEFLHQVTQSSSFQFPPNFGSP